MVKMMVELELGTVKHGYNDTLYNDNRLITIPRQELFIFTTNIVILGLRITISLAFV